MNKKISKLIDAQKRANSALHDAIAKQYVAGSEIIWERGGTRLIGVVVMTGLFDRIKVRNTMTGKEYWIRIYEVR